MSEYNTDFLFSKFAFGFLAEEDSPGLLLV